MTKFTPWALAGALALSVAVCAPTAAATEAFSGGADLKLWCDNMDRDDIYWGLCVGSITAAHDMIMSYQNFEDAHELVCIAPETSRGDIVFAVREHINEHPEQLDYSLGDLVLTALINKFPCVGAL